MENTPDLPEQVCLMWLNGVMVAVLDMEIDPVIWLKRNGYVLVSDVKWVPLQMTVCVRHGEDGETIEAMSTTKEVVRLKDIPRPVLPY
jgi:hypothetical protein